MEANDIELTKPQVRAMAELVALFYSEPKNQAAFKAWMAEKQKVGKKVAG